MKKKHALVFVLPLLVCLLTACSGGKSNKVYGYTYDDLVKAASNTSGFVKNTDTITKVQKYENNGETRYMIISDDSKEYPNDPNINYLSLPSDYIEKHRTNKIEHYIYGQNQEKPDVQKVLETYKVNAKDKTFEKETE